VTWLAVAAAALVAAAPQFAPKPGELLGGGSVGPAPTPGHLDIAYTTIRVSKDGKSIHVYGDWPARCGRGVVTAAFDHVVRLQPDGSFVAAGVLSTAGAVGSFEVQGRLERTSIGGRELDVGTGTGDAELSQRRGGTATCKTRTVTWQVRSAPSVGGPPTPKRGSAYFGSDSDTDPVVLRVSKDARSVVQAGLEFGLKCRYSRFTFASDVFPRIPIDPGGRFETVQRYTAPLAAYRNATAHFTSRLAGRFAASTVSGSLRVDVSIKAKSGAAIDTCHTTTTFAASL
jgi:hypothetical protein